MLGGGLGGTGGDGGGRDGGGGGGRGCARAIETTREAVVLGARAAYGLALSEMATRSLVPLTTSRATRGISAPTARA